MQAQRHEGEQDGALSPATIGWAMHCHEAISFYVEPRIYGG